MKASRKGGRRIHVLVLAAYLLLSTLCILTLRTTLMENADDLAQALSSSYAYEMESGNRVYETLITFACESIDERVRNGWSDENIQLWAQRFFSVANSLLGRDKVDVYMIMDGRHFSEDGFMDDGVDYRDRPWYTEDERITYSTVYNDIFTGERTVTLARKCSDADIVTAIDIRLEAIDFRTSMDNLPNGTSLFLSDSLGHLILFESAWENDYSQEEVQAYMTRLLGTIGEGRENSIIGIDGQKRIFHYSMLGNGWLAVITIPYSQIFQDLNRISLAFTLAFVAALATVLIYIYREERFQRMARERGQTVQILGDLYYALYRVDIDKGVYEMYKGSSQMKERIATSGPYSVFLDALAGLLDPQDLEAFRSSFSLSAIREHVKSGTRSFGGDFRRSFSGSWRTINVMMVYNEEMASGQVILCFRDVEDERRSEREKRELLDRSLVQARESIRAKDAFFSNMSHDMRTPLNAIIGLVRIAQSSQDCEKKDDCLAKIDRSGHQLLELVNDILEIGKSQHESFILDLRQTDIALFLSDTVAPFEAMAEADHKKLFLSISTVHNLVMADTFRLSQIINNILSNALKFTENGKGEVSVSLQEECGSTQLSRFILKIRDNGPGISEDFLRHIYEPYARETRFSSQISGTGLGMPIVKNLVTQMSGTIDIESEVGKGTEVTVTLPLSTETGEEKDEEREEHIDNIQSLEGRRIILAEDNAINMEIALEMLHEEGLDITQAWNGRQALEAYLEKPSGYYDAILLDMKMPEMDGLEASRMIRSSAREDALTIPIIAVTANAFSDDIAATREAGMDDHVSKPIDFALLSRTLARLIERREKK